MARLGLSLLALLVFASCGAHAALVPGKWFDRAIIVVLENTAISEVLNNTVLRGLSQGSCARLYGNYWASTHVSEPNYLTMISGDYYTIQDDANHVINNVNCDNPYAAFGLCYLRSTNTIHDLLDDKGISWKVYAEGYPGSIPPSKLPTLVNSTVEKIGCPNANNTGHKCFSPGGCFFGQNTGSLATTPPPADPQLYARKHVPQLFFDSFVYDYKMCSRVTSEATFFKDLAVNHLPQYSFYVPNQLNDGHGTTRNPSNTSYTASWLADFITKVKSAPGIAKSRTTLIVVYDENDFISHKNQVFAMSIGLGNGSYCTVTPPPVFKCPAGGCVGTPSQQKQYQLDCLNTTNFDGSTVKAPYAPQECAAAGGLAGWSSPVKVVDGLKADVATYSHYSLFTTIKENWDLATLGQPGESAKPLAFS